MAWKEDIFLMICDLCSTQGSNIFLLEDFVTANLERLSDLYPENLHVEEKIRQTMQYLRDDGRILFVDNRGTYELIDR